MFRIYKVILNQLGIRSSENWKLSFENLKHAHVWKRTRCKRYTIEIDKVFWLQSLFEDKLIHDNVLSKKYMKINKQTLIEKFQPSEGDVITTQTRYPRHGGYQIDNYIMVNDEELKKLHNITKHVCYDKFPICYWVRVINQINIYIPCSPVKEFCFPNLPRKIKYYTRYIDKCLEYTIFSTFPVDDFGLLYTVQTIACHPDLMMYLASINFDYDIHTTLVIVC